MTCTIHPEGWISVPIDQNHERCAQQIRQERDQQYGNIFVEVTTDERWVGDLGEMVFNSWFNHEGITGFHWQLEKTAGQPDFVTSRGVRIGVKTVKRRVPPQTEYTAQITAQYANEPIDHFFFMSYELPQHRMWLLGGIEKGRFLQESHLYRAGEWVHENYQVREGHEIFNIAIAKLVLPKAWIALIKDEGNGY